MQQCAPAVSAVVERHSAAQVEAIKSAWTEELARESRILGRLEAAFDAKSVRTSTWHCVRMVPGLTYCFQSRSALARSLEKKALTLEVALS
jgi:hypothetical protein